MHHEFANPELSKLVPRLPYFDACNCFRLELFENTDASLVSLSDKGACNIDTVSCEKEGQS